MSRREPVKQRFDFLELPADRFEDMVRQLAGTIGVDWERALEPVGRHGSDRGRDIVGMERVVSAGRQSRSTREWRFQVKRYQRIGPSELRAVVRDAVPDPTDSPYALIVAVACRASSAAFESFHDEASGRGVIHHEMWTRDTLTDLLLQPVNARVAALYFGDAPAIEGTVAVPLGLERSSGRDLHLLLSQSADV